MRMFASAASASSASSKMRSSARSMPAAPSTTGHVISSVCDLKIAERFARRLPRLRLGQVGEPHRLLRVPAAVRLTAGHLTLDLLVLDDPSALEVDEEELARLEPALAQDLLRGVVEDAGLRRHDDPAIARLVPASRAQAVAVEHRADHAPVRERDRRRSVPGLQ